MSYKEPAREALKASTEKLLHTLESFPTGLFNNKPPSGGWSAAEVTEHLLALEKNINHILNVPASLVTDRRPDEKIEIVRQVFGDMTKKYNSPSFIKPSGIHLDKQQLIADLSAQKQQLLVNIEKTNLEELCTDFPHNRLGTFTKLEWIYFTVYHTKRHLQQIENIRQELEPV